MLNQTSVILHSSLFCRAAVTPRRSLYGGRQQRCWRPSHSSYGGRQKCARRPPNTQRYTVNAQDIQGSGTRITVIFVVLAPPNS
ncbi:MAG: hypothetical protein HXL34_05150 [Prevotellaceae bacterium]|nr:hypothetical protein [Prevotellaceae bacterium]